MDKLSSILGSRDFSEPPEIGIIKDYVRAEFKTDISVSIRDKMIIINAPNSALAGTLRLRGPVIKRLLNTDKRLVFQSI